MNYYSQFIINGAGEEKLKRIVNEEPFKEQITDNAFYNAIMKYAIEHYLVKRVVNNSLTANEKKYLSEIYKDFKNHPYNYARSPLLNNTIIETLFRKDAVKVIQFCDNYYSEQTAQRLYKESKVRSLTDSEKNQLYLFFIKSLKTNNPKLQNIIKSEIKRIIDSNILPKDMHPKELQFYCQYVSNDPKNKGINNVVLIVNDDSTKRGNHINGLITINQSAKNITLSTITKTVFHEARHAIQDAEIKNIDSVAGFEMACQQLFYKYLNSNAYNSYKSNYQYSTIELDAEHMGYYNASLFFHEFGRLDLCDELRKHSEEHFSKRNYYHFMIDQRGIPVSVDKYIVENLDRIISEHKEVLINYSVLNNFYDSNGNRKTFEEILKQRINKTEYKKMFEYYLNYGIRQDELSKINLNNYTKDDIRKFTNSFKMMYKDRTSTIKDYFRDNDTINKSNNKRLTRKQITTTTNYELVLSTKLLSFINDNFDKIVSSQDEKMSNTHPIYDFLLDFRDFNINDIENEALKNNPAFLSKLKDYLTVYHKLLNKVNEKYLTDRLNDLTEQEKNTIILVSNNNITLEEYMYKYILPNMDTHQKVDTKKGKQSIREILNYLKHRNNLELQTMLDELPKKEIETNTRKQNEKR